jgi:hypothetical protein
MPATNPRLTITLEPTTAAQLRRISELTGNSQSSLIAELLAGTSAVFDRLILVLEAAHSARASMSGQLAKDLAQAQSRIEDSLGLSPALDAAMEQTLPLFEEFITRRTVRRFQERRAERAGGTTRSGGVVARSASSATPPSNRGVRSPSSTPKTVTRKGAKHGPV